MNASAEVITFTPVRQRSASQWRPGQTVQDRTRDLEGGAGSSVKWIGFPYTRPTFGWRRASAAERARDPGVSMSSASRRTRNSPVTSPSPSLKVAAGPWLISCATTWTSGCRGQRTCDPKAVVRGAIVDDDDVHLDAFLRQRALDRLREVPRVVEAGNDDRDGRTVRRGERTRPNPQPFPYAGPCAGGPEVS